MYRNIFQTSRTGFCCLIALISGFFSIAQLRAASGLPVPAGTWTMSLTQGLPVGRNGWHQLVYAPVLKRAVMLALYHQRNSEPNESMVAYNFETNSWEVLDMGGNFHTESLPEGGESQGYFDYNPNNNTIIYHCCTTGSNQPENVNHTWWYDLLGQAGRDKHTSPKPPTRALQPGGAFDAAHNVFVFHGGDSNVGTWTYDPGTNAWAKKALVGTPPNDSLILPAVAYSSADQKIYLFGGESGGTYYSDLYVYDVPTNTWAAITPAGGVKPSGRYRHAFAYDSTNNIFLMYGGQNASGLLNDTWVYNPVANTWTQLNPPNSPPVPTTTAIFAMLTYDSDHNVFVLAQSGVDGYYGGQWTAYAMQTWLFRYQGTGPNAGTLLSNAAPAPGSLNRTTVGWAKDPALASAGNSLYVAWSESSSPFDLTDAAWPHIYVSQYSGGNWTPLGSSFQSVSSTAIKEAHAPSLAIVGGLPWASWYESDNAGNIARVYAKQWDGVSSWLGGAVGVNGAGSPIYQGQSDIAAAGSTPEIALLEVDKSVFPQRTLAYVKEWNGTAWTTKGATLNLNTAAGSTALSVSMTGDGPAPYVAWSEYVHGLGNGNADIDTVPQIYASVWSGSQWTRLGGSLNVSSTAWASDPSIAYLGGQPYVAWTERTQSGNAQLYVKTWNGSSWALVGSGALNRAPGAGWAFHPSLVPNSAANKLDLAWVEQTALGIKARVFVSEYASGVWTSLGGSLNADPVQGSAQRVSLGIFNGNPVAAWGEINLGAQRQIYVKQWTGSSWTQLSGSGGPPDTAAPTAPPSSSAHAVSNSQIDVTWGAATDVVGVAGYFVYRGGTQVADVTSSRGYSDTGLAPNTSYSYTIAAHDAAGNHSTLTSPVTATTLGGDTTPPMVSMTAPANGATVSGTITVSANATDNVAVSAVQFKLDGANLGSPVTGAGPSYSISWNSATTSNGSHTLTATASDAAGNTASGSVTFNVSNVSAPQAVFQLHADASEVTGVTNGSVITPAVAPPGFKGIVSAKGSGSVNFAPGGGSGNGVYFLACCSNSNNAYYKFSGSGVGSVFDVNQGEVSFYLTSRYTFAQRKALPAGQRYAFDVRDGNGHLFSFFTQITSGKLEIDYMVGGTSQFYFVPVGTEDSLYGLGVTLKVNVKWDGTTAKLYLNNGLVKSAPYTKSTPNWTVNSNFNVGALEYLSFGGYNSSDDIIDEFSVMGTATVADSTPPVVNMTAPANGANVSGTITVSANATDNVAVNAVQFKLDGANLGSPVTGAGPSYSISWNSAGASNGSHTLSATASDAAGNTASSSVTVNVSNATPPPVISAVSAGSVTSSGAIVSWNTDKAADSQVAYGTTSSYGSTTTVDPNLVTSHSVTLSGLAASTTYHYQVRSRDAQGSLATSADFTFTTAPASGPQPVFQLHADASEVSGVTNGSVITPAVAPPGFTGSLVVNGSGSVIFAPGGGSGNGVYFMACCSNSNNAYYKFSGSGVGSVFDVNQGEVSFYLTSRYTFAQRKALPAGQRYAFDVRDGNGHLFSFLTQITSGNLEFEYIVGGATQYYFVPPGTEDTLYGSGVTLKVNVKWDGTTAKLYLNNALVKSAAYTKRAPNWTATSNFDVGAFEYLTYGGYNSSDDIIDEFSVMGTATVADSTPPVVNMTAPANGANVSGTITVSANATDNVAVSAVQFKLDGANLGSPVTGAGPAYSISWNSATTTNGSHTLTATASDAAGNTASSSVTVNVSNATPPPVISAVSATSVTSSGAVIGWNTDKAADSQVAYGTSSSYGSTTTLDPNLVTSHSVTLSGLTASTTYHYQVRSRDAQGNLATSADFTFTTAPASGPQPVFQLHADASEVSGVTNGSVITPAVAPPGFTGSLVVNGSGSVIFAPGGGSGNGVYFMACCSNSNNAYYKFSGSGVGSVFDVNQGEVSFYLTSRYTFAQRKALPAGQRYAFDVRDGNGHLFSFLTQITSGKLELDYIVGGTSQFYFVPVGTEDTLFGSGVTLKVNVKWDGTTAKLYLNNVLVKSAAYTKRAPNWTATSNFDVGALEYLTYGGYDSSDDIIDEFAVFH